MDLIGIKTDKSRGYGAPTLMIDARPARADMDDTQKLDSDVLVLLAGREYRIHIIPRSPDRNREYNKDTRVYVQIPDVDLGMEHPAFGSVRGSGTDDDKAWRKYNRLEMKVMRALIETFVSLIRTLTEFDETDIGFRFSRKAGCTCPCSPGFVASDRIMFQGPPVDIWIGEVEPEPEPVKAADGAVSGVNYLVQADAAARDQSAILEAARAAGRTVVEDMIIREAEATEAAAPLPRQLEVLDRIILDQPYSGAEVAVVREIIAGRLKP
jgi:hypothetical protein